MTRRAAFALPLVLGFLLVLAVLVMGLFTLVRGGLRQTRLVMDDTVQVCAADALLAREISRLKAAPWGERWYARRGERGLAGAVDSGRFHGLDTFVAVQDARGADGAPLFGLVDVFLRVADADSAMSYVCRLWMRDATAVRPTAVLVRYWARVAASVDQLDGRERALARMADDLAARARSAPETAATLREVDRRLAAYEASAESVVAALARGAGPAAEAERAFTAELAAGDAAFHARPPDARKAVDAYTRAVALAGAAIDPHRAENAPRALLRLGAAEELAAAIEPLASPDRPAALALAAAHYEQIGRDHARAPEAPRALVRRAWLALKGYDPARPESWRSARSAAAGLLDELAVRFPGEHLWDEDRTAAELALFLKERLAAGVSWTQADRVHVASLASTQPLRPGPAGLLVPGLGAQGPSSWSADGAALAFESEVESGRRAIFTCDSSGLALRRWTPDAWEDCRAATLSPDGARLAFARRTGGRAEICTLGLDGSELRVVSPGNLSAGDPAWADGSTLTFATQSGLWLGSDPVDFLLRQLTSDGVHARPAPAPAPYDTVVFLGGNPGPLLALSLEGTDPTPETITSDGSYTSARWFPADPPVLVAARQAGAGGALVVLNRGRAGSTPFLESATERLDGPAFAPLPVDRQPGGRRP